MILDALERLLHKTPLRDLNVELIAEAAGITRTRFYFYYKSKQEAYAGLLERCAASAFSFVHANGTWFAREPDQRPRDALIETLQLNGAAWKKYRYVLREAADLWNALPEVQRIWIGAMNSRVEICARTIERERELGVAPPGPAADLIARSLVWAGERQQFLHAIGALGALTQDELSEATLGVWMRAIYMSDDPEPTPLPDTRKRRSASPVR
jgi:AcrR family transcriptional regulator